MHPNVVYVHLTTMEDRELYRRILGIEYPWRVASVDLQLAPKEVQRYLAHEDLSSWPCAECGTPCQLYDHQPERRLSPRSWGWVGTKSTASWLGPSGVDWHVAKPNPSVIWEWTRRLSVKG